MFNDLFSLVLKQIYLEILDQNVINQIVSNLFGFSYLSFQGFWEDILACYGFLLHFPESFWNFDIWVLFQLIVDGSYLGVVQTKSLLNEEEEIFKQLAIGVILFVLKQVESKLDDEQLEAMEVQLNEV